MSITDKNGAVNRDAISTASSQGNKSEPMCSTVREWGISYTQKHGYISIAVCIFGITAPKLDQVGFVKSSGIFSIRYAV